MCRPRASLGIARTVVLCVVLLAASMAEAAGDRQTRVVVLTPERSLTIELTIGTVRILGSDRTDAELVIDRQAPTTEGLVRIPVTIRETAGRVIVRGVQEEGMTDPAFRVDLVLRLPRNANIEDLRLLEGKLSINQFSGRIKASVTRGPIEGSDVSGTLRLETEIGSIMLTRARLSPDGLLRLRTFNGDVRLGLAQRPIDARILALALNGTIRSEIPLTMKATWGPRWSEATLGRGEPVISIDVVTGTIEIKSPKAGP